MKGFRSQPKDTNKIISMCQMLMNDFASHASPYDMAMFKKKHKEWRATNGTPTSKTMTGYYSFIVDNTKV